MKGQASPIIRYSLVMVLTALVIGGMYSVINRETSMTGSVVHNGVIPVQAAQIIDDDAELGEASAPVTLVAFSDYQCTYCRRFATETLPLLKEEYISSGKVRFVFRDFPQESNPSARSAAEAAECARSLEGQSAYWRMHNLLIAEQNKLDTGNAAGPVTKAVEFTQEDIISWAQDAGYNIRECMENSAFADEVQKDAADALSLGVRSAPTFFIGSQVIEGAESYETFKAVIEKALS